MTQKSFNDNYLYTEEISPNELNEYKEKDKDARIAKLPGRWSGRIHVDEISDVDLEETNLDTQQSVKRRVNTRNASQSSPIILKK